MKESLGFDADASGGAIVDQTIFTVPAGYRAIVSMFFMSNIGGSTTTVGSFWHDGVNLPFLSGKSLSAGDYLQFGGPYGAWLSMDEGDHIGVSVSSGGQCAVIISYELERKGRN